MVILAGILSGSGGVSGGLSVRREEIPQVVEAVVDLPATLAS